MNHCALRIESVMPAVTALAAVHAYTTGIFRAEPPCGQALSAAPHDAAAHGPWLCGWRPPDGLQGVAASDIARDRDPLVPSYTTGMINIRRDLTGGSPK